MIGLFRVLVCGGRDFGCPDRRRPLPPEVIARGNREVLTLFWELDSLDQERRVTRLISGGARGADSLAELWARSRLIPIDLFPANWNRDGKAAGPIRNRRMLEEGRPDLVVAFPGGSGTANMVRIATAAGVPVRLIQ